MNQKKQLLVNTIIIAIGKLSTQVVSFLLLPLYTSKLSPAEYGTYDFLVTLSTFLLPIITLLMEESMFRFLIDADDLKSKKSIKVARKSEIKTGKAYINCTLDNNEVSMFEIKINSVLLDSTGNKNMIIQITDKNLIEKTGGIVQGMSGSPIVQDGKLVGAVTHVFLNDPTKGYAVFAENMIEDLLKVMREDRTS